jgi:nitrous oxide reductase accessory protein NosL
MTLRPKGARLWVAAGLAFLALACGGGEDAPVAAEHVALPIADQEDAVCGMLVRDQSAPRGQVLHRDGSRFYFCSVGDLLVHRAAPSPHGRVESGFVEVLDPDEAPGKSHTGEHPWAPIESAAYVVGVKRPGIMGPPVLVYRDTETAVRVASSHPGARALRFDELVEWWNERQAE